jgi:Trk K+ transport system NAD-binding subunit
LLGFHRDASSLLYDLLRHDPDLVRDTLVVDFNVSLHSGIAAVGATVKYGDLSNPETLQHLGLDRCRVIVCTIPDDLLRGIDNRNLVRVVRETAPEAAIIANAIAIDEVPRVYEAGADFVYLNRLEAARTLQRAIRAGIDLRLDEFREERRSRDQDHPQRKEILN